MTTFIFANNVNSTLAGAVSTGATTITLSSTANLPASIPSGSVLVITLNDVATKKNFEIVYATAITGATLTVLRAQEGTAALAWLVGDFAYSPPTAGQMLAMGQLAAANTWTGANIFIEPVVVGPAALSIEAVNLGQFAINSNSTGKWVTFPNGMIIQTGIVSVGSPSAVTFPTPFPNSCWGLTVSEAHATGQWSLAHPTTHGFDNLTQNGYLGWAEIWNGTIWTGGTFSQSFIAIGN